jgi:ubiquinol oxidase
MDKKESRIENTGMYSDTLHVHHYPQGFGDRVALYFVKSLRFFADAFFSKRYGHRAVVLETIAAVPGMVGGMLLHLKSLRRMEDDHGWIHTLLDEAENERMHLMTFVEIAKPTWLERALVIIAQGVFYLTYLIIYLISSKTAHRIVGYLEEEAVISYTQYLAYIDNGETENTTAPQIAVDYWNLPQEARLREVVEVIRADEMRHRDVNHCIADKIAGQDCKIDIPQNAAPETKQQLQDCHEREAP